MPSGRIIVVCPNPAVEITYFCNRLSLGTQNAGEQRITSGGKGINIARILITLGCDALLATCLGGFSGEYIRQHLTTLGAQTKFIAHEGNTRFSTVIYDSLSIDATVIRSEGEGLPLYIETEFIGLIVAELSRNDLVCVAGSLPKGFSSAFSELVCKKIAQLNGRAMMDVSGDSLLSALRANPFLVKINQQEALGIMVGAHSPSVRQLLDLLISKGAENVLITLGREGWVAYIDGKYLRCNISANESGFDIGAGDAMMAGLLHYLHAGFGWSDTLEYATRLAAASTYCRSSGELLSDRVQQSPSCSINAL